MGRGNTTLVNIIKYHSFTIFPDLVLNASFKVIYVQFNSLFSEYCKNIVIFIILFIIDDDKYYL